MAVTFPIDTDQGSPREVRLRATTDQGLLDTFAALTHRIHECKGSVVAGRCDGPCTDQRAQRDLVAAEMLRRMA